MESRAELETLNVVKAEFSDIPWDEKYFPDGCVVSNLLPEDNINTLYTQMMKRLSKEHKLYEGIVTTKRSSQDTKRFRIIIKSEAFNKVGYYEFITAFLNKVHSFGRSKWHLFLTEDKVPKIRVYFPISNYPVEGDVTVNDFLNFSEEKFPTLSKEIKESLKVVTEKYCTYYRILDPVLLNKIHVLAVKDFNHSLSIRP